MKIAILGYGRMGKMIEKLALADGHEIIYKTSKKPDLSQLKKADVAIDFSVTEAALSNIQACFSAQLPVVSGTTGWLDVYQTAIDSCNQQGGTFLYASNFSVGVNLFFQLNEYLAKLMANQHAYQVKLREIHHTKKRDKPSGTAISLAEGIIAHSDKTSWKLVEKEDEKNSNKQQVPIAAERYEDVKGTHFITYQSAIDTIEIKHTAHSREGFAKGAILAAEFIQDKKGIFSMRDVLKNLI